MNKTTFKVLFANLYGLIILRDNRTYCANYVKMVKIFDCNLVEIFAGGSSRIMCLAEDGRIAAINR